jgi:hypothetical protein
MALAGLWLGYSRWTLGRSRWRRCVLSECCPRRREHERHSEDDGISKESLRHNPSRSARANSRVRQSSNFNAARFGDYPLTQSQRIAWRVASNIVVEVREYICPIRHTFVRL